MAIGKEEILDWIDQASMLDISDLVKDIEKKYDVTAASPMMAVAAAGAGAPAAEAQEEKNEFDVVLSAIGEKKINVIKVVREVTSLGLKEAKDLVEAAPKVVREGLPKEEAEAIKQKFVDAGATAEIK